MLDNLTSKMAARGDGAIPLDELREDYKNKVSLWINNNVRPGSVTYRMLSLIILNIGNFLRQYNVKVTQFLVLDAAHGLQRLLFGNLFKDPDLNGANATASFSLESRINVTNDMYMGRVGSVSSS